MRKILTVLTIAFLAAAFAYAGGDKEDSSDSMMKMEPMDNGDAGDTMMKADAAMMKPPFDLKGLGPQIVAFESEAQAQALAKTKTVIYYFAASWCPSCQATYRSLKADYKIIPEDTVIVVVNYDLGGKLNTKYGVTYQHTYVVIDDKGNKKSIWTGTDTVKKILDRSMAETAM